LKETENTNVLIKKKKKKKNENYIKMGRKKDGSVWEDDGNQKK
jgi:hypothetical protein